MARRSGRSGLVAAKVAVVLVHRGGPGRRPPAPWRSLLGWRPRPRSLAGRCSAVTTVVGAAAFAGLGLAIAGILRPEATLVVANVLFLLALGFGGVLVPIGDLPAPVADVVRLLPVGALAETFAAALGNGTPIAAPFGILLFWAVLADVVAARTFRWD